MFSTDDLSSNPSSASSEKKNLPKASRFRKLLRVAGAVISLLLLCYGTAYFVEYRLCSKLEGTGDELFDTYAKAVRDRQAARLFYTGTIEGSPNPAALPDDVVAAWEDDFGDDPRYWELRCWNANSEHLPYLSADHPAAWKTGNEYLRQAVDSGIAGSNIHLMLYLRRRGEHNSLQRKIADLNAEELTELRTMLDAAISSEPVQAMPYYFRAMFHLEEGQFDEGKRYLELGNQQPSCLAVGIYPQNFVHARQLSGEVSGSELISQLVLMGFSGGSIDYWWTLKTAATELRPHVHGSGDLELLDEFNTALCRIGSEYEGNDWVSVIVSSHLRSNARAALLAHHQPSHEQRATALWAFDFADAMNRTYWDQNSRILDQVDFRMGECTASLGFLFVPGYLNRYLRITYQETMSSGGSDIAARCQYLFMLDYTADDFGYASFREKKSPFNGNPGPLLTYELKRRVETPADDL